MKSFMIRWKVLNELLSNKSGTTSTSISKKLNISEPLAKYHLTQLYDAGLIVKKIKNIGKRKIAVYKTSSKNVICWNNVCFLNICGRPAILSCPYYDTCETKSEPLSEKCKLSKEVPEKILKLFRRVG